MQQNTKNTLGFLGEDFQKSLVKAFFVDKPFFKDLCPIIDQNAFTEYFLKRVVGNMREFYEKYEHVPSFDTLASVLSSSIRDDIERETTLALLEELKRFQIESIDYIKDQATRFFKQQNIIKTANTILQIAEAGNDNQYEQCVDLLQKALNAGSRNEMGSSVFDELNEVLSDDYRVAIPTGIGKLDEALEGGLGKGELGLIIGSSGFGKTTLTTSIAAHAATYKCDDNSYEGYKVLQIVFEDRVKQIQRKHIGKITGIEAKDLSKPEFEPHVREILENYDDATMLAQNLKIVKFPSGEITASAIKRYIKKLMNGGFKPDVLIVDYFECLEHEKDANTSNEYEREGKTMRKFEAMAGELDMAIWIPSQGSRDSINMEIVTMDKVSGSIKKAQIAHVIISIARTIEDIENSKATISLLKNRAGKSGKIFNNVDFNNGTCRISTDNCDDYDSFAMYGRNQQDEMTKTQREIYKALRTKKTQQEATV